MATSTTAATEADTESMCRLLLAVVALVLLQQPTRVVVVVEVLGTTTVVRVLSFSVTSHQTHPQQVSLLAVEQSQAQTDTRFIRLLRLVQRL